MRAYDHHDEKKRTWHVWEFDLAEYLRASRELPLHEKNREQHSARAFRGIGDWNTTWRGGTREEAMTLCTWPEGRAKMASFKVDDLQMPDMPSIKRVRRWVEDGDEFSKDRFDAGHFDCWETRKRRRRNHGGHVVRMTIELCAGANASADSLVWSGAAAIKLADTLEAKGYRVEIDITVSNDNLNGSHHNTVDVIRAKNADDPLNVDALLLAAAHPLFFRFCVFSSFLRRSVKCTEGLGTVSATPKALRGDIHIAKVFNQQDAQRVVREAINERNNDR